MSEQLSPLSIAPGILTKETLPLGIVALKVSNTSPYDLSYSGYGASGDDVIPSGVENILYGAVYNSGVFQATLVNNRNITPANAGVILLVAYYSDHEVPQGSWPVSIPTSTVNVSGNTGVTTSQFLQNDTSNAGTVFIESTVGTNQATKVTVDGIWNLSIIIAGVLHKLLTSQTSGNQLVLGQLNDIVEIASNLIADGTLSVKGSSSFDNGNAFTDGAGNFTIQDILINTTLQVLGATHLDSGNIFTDGLGNYTANNASGATITLEKAGAKYVELLDNINGPSIDVPTGQNLTFSINGTSIFYANHGTNNLAVTDGIDLVVGGVSRMFGQNGVPCGSGTTISHSMATTPNVIVATPEGSQAFSATVGVGNIGSSTFRATVGSGSAIDWLGWNI